MISKIIKSVESVLYKKDINPLSHAALTFLSYVYGAVVCLRNYCYFKAGLCKRIKLDRPVVSIGNITVGGSGKTPLTIHLTSLLKRSGVNAVVVTRGYKSAGKGVRVLTADALEAAAKEPELYGDEPLLMAMRLEGTPVVISPDRAEGSAYAIKNYSADVIVLDDGFQHARLWRDIDIVLVDGKRGVGSGYMLPRGPLREPQDSLKRADVVLVKGEGAYAGEVRGFDKPIIGFSYRPVCLVGRGGDIKDTDYLKGKKIAALSAIADPESFTETLRSMGAEVKTVIAFQDHHWFRAPDIEKIKHEGKDVDLVITTEKDMVRLNPYAIGGINLYALRIDVDIDDSLLAKELLKITKRKAAGY